MRGRLPDVVLARLTEPKQGMFPGPKELKLQCSCPDYATMCKHIAATLYGVGHLLDSEPGLFFKMRGVDQSELVYDALTTQTADDAMGLNQQSDLAGEDLGAIFGIDFATTSDAQSAVSSAGDAKSKVKTKRKTASPKKLSNPTIAKKTSRKSKPTGAVASGNLKAAKARVVVTRKKRVAVSDKPGKASAKQAKR
jgi:uncharacterized Zn finger protein